MSKYYKIHSKLRAPTGVDYIIDNKGNNSKTSVRVLINGAARPGDIEKDLIPPTFLDKKTFELLKKYQGKKQSPFTILIGEGKIIPQECGFNDLPDDEKRRFDPELYEKIEALRKKKEYELLASFKDEKDEEDKKDD